MVSLPNITPLSSDGGYLRWKESMLLVLNTIGIAHVLFEDPPSGDGASLEAARKWARENTVCHGHILAKLSNIIFPDYVCHVTGRALWQAVARTYNIDTPFVSWRKFTEFEFKFNGSGAPSFLGQLAHAEALGFAGQPLHPDLVDYTLGQKLLPDVANHAMVVLSDGSISVSMDNAWEVARMRERNCISEEDELNVRAAMAEDERTMASLGYSL